MGETMVQRIATMERHLLKVVLYGLILRGIFVPSEEPMARLFGQLCFLFGVAALAIVAWSGRPERQGLRP